MPRMCLRSGLASISPYSLGSVDTLKAPLQVAAEPTASLVSAVRLQRAVFWEKGRWGFDKAASITRWYGRHGQRQYLRSRGQSCFRVDVHQAILGPKNKDPEILLPQRTENMTGTTSCWLPIFLAQQVLGSLPLTARFGEGSISPSPSVRVPALDVLYTKSQTALAPVSKQ
ncbi:hypothetical protein B0T17DRAFT_509427 [Bombardia bombarda]|uniref:Uncharacterized protein n=1 Tax=Bombardia bombarda TaxID=252184 RepID=A0AA39WLX3_9PEZI|nr:hypothetical protein B0T17DRAFT_509427 [Bombardia bombarda]